MATCRVQGAGAFGPAHELDLILGLLVDGRIHFRELEEVLAVIAGLGIVVGGCRETEIVLTPVRLRAGVVAGGDVVEMGKPECKRRAHSRAAR